MPPAKKQTGRTPKASHHIRDNGPKNRALQDMKRFYGSLDLKEMWEEFTGAVASSGKLRYRSARQFANAKGENETQKDFLAWLLGPAKPRDPVRASIYTFAEPYDFDAKRKFGGWFNEENLRAHSKAIRQEMVALDALRAAGNGITINSLARMEQLAAQLDTDFGGVFFVDGLSLDDNVKRASAYIRLHEKILGMIAQAQDLYAKSHGINFADMSGFERLLTAQALALATGDVKRETRAAQVLGRIVEMTLEKSTKYQTELPASVEKVIVDTKQELVPAKRDPKMM